MHEDLERLEQVDRLDRELNAHQRGIDKGRAALAEARDAVETSEQAKAQIEQILADNRKQQLALQRTAQDHETNRGRAMKALEMGQGNAEAAERQIERTSELIDEVETQQLELLEAQDDQETTLAQADEALASARQHLASLEVSVPQERAAHEAEMAQLTSERGGFFDALPSDVARRYGDLRARNKWAVARVVDGCCAACRVDVPAQQQADIKRGIIQPCRRCHRWLVIS